VKALITQKIVLASLLILTIAFLGCKAPPVADSGFVEEPEMMKECEFLPFHRAWKDGKINFKKYDKIMVAPIFTEAQLDKSWLEKSNMYYYLGSGDKDLAKFADYTTEALKKAVEEDEKFSLVEKPDSQTVILELALVKVVPGKPVIAGIGNIGNFTPIGFMLSPIKMTAHGTMDSPFRSSVAIEGRIRDGETKKVIATFADRRKQRTAFFNLKDFSSYGNPKQLVNEWAEQIIEVLNSNMGRDGKVKRRKSLNPINI